MSPSNVTRLSNYLINSNFNLTHLDQISSVENIADLSCKLCNKFNGKCGPSKIEPPICPAVGLPKPGVYERAGNMMGPCYLTEMDIHFMLDVSGYRNFVIEYYKILIVKG